MHKPTYALHQGWLAQQLCSSDPLSPLHMHYLRGGGEDHAFPFQSGFNFFKNADIRFVRTCVRPSVCVRARVHPSVCVCVCVWRFQRHKDFTATSGLF
uniref:Uncharacterized protein n=1 Tax=Anguilla anguilla TaxID=7936 RepID=A0A0E9X2U0_ANGAN